MARNATKRTPQAHVLREAGRQHGGIRTTHALALGASRHQLAGMVASGLLRRRHRGVYVSTAVPADHRQAAMVAVLAAPDGAVASHETALHLHGLGPAPSEVHVTVAAGQRVRMAGVVAHRSPVPAAHRATIGPIPVTNLARTLVDLAGRADLVTFAEVLDPLLTSGRVRPERLLTVLDEIVRAPGRHGTTLLRTALDPWLGPIEPDSPAEARLLRLLRERGHGGHRTQVEVEVDGRCYRIDVAWPEHRVGLEYAGRLAHGPRGWGRDERRAAELERAGWVLREVDATDLLPGEPALWRWLDQHLRAAA